MLHMRNEVANLQLLTRHIPVSIIAIALLLSGCAVTLPHKHMEQRDHINMSLIYGLIDVSKVEMELDSVLIVKRAQSKNEKDRTIHARVAGDIFYLENLEEGNYEIIEFTARLGSRGGSSGSVKNTKTINARNKHQKLKFSIVQPGAYFIADLVLVKIDAAYNSYRLDERIDRFEKKRALTTVLFYNNDTNWSDLARNNPVDHVPALDLQFNTLPIAETSP